MQASHLAIGLLCFLGAIALVNGALGPALGIDIASGGERVHQTEDEIENDIDTSVTDGGEVSALSALSLLVDMVHHLGDADSILENFGVPAPIAGFLVSPIVFVIALALVSIILRTRL